MRKKKPDWLKVKFRRGEELKEIENILDEFSLNTVCEEATCPNRNECFNRKTATFMIMGNKCTRNCRFCDVIHGQPQPLEEEEPDRIAQAVKVLDLKHVVVTSVTRDDLVDGGSAHFARVINRTRDINSEVTIEVLIPDFGGDSEALEVVINARPEIINHNVETIPGLYAEVRPDANYNQSLTLLKRAGDSDRNILTKSGIMLGLGEKENEIIRVLKDLREVECDLLTIGQYLSPSKDHYPVVEYVHPDIFRKYKDIGMEMGFKYIASGPLVRSSYHAGEAYNSVLKQ